MPALTPVSDSLWAGVIRDDESSGGRDIVYEDENALEIGGAGGGGGGGARGSVNNNLSPSA